MFIFPTGLLDHGQPTSIQLPVILTRPNRVLRLASREATCYYRYV